MRARTSTVSMASNRPVYSSHSTTSFSSGLATETAGGGEAAGAWAAFSPQAVKPSVKSPKTSRAARNFGWPRIRCPPVLRLQSTSAKPLPKWKAAAIPDAWIIFVELSHTAGAAPAAIPPRAYGPVESFRRKTPLILSFSPRGEGTLELPPADVLGFSLPLGERDRVRGSPRSSQPDLVSCTTVIARRLQPPW